MTVSASNLTHLPEFMLTREKFSIEPDNHLFVHLPNVLVFDGKDDEASWVVAEQRFLGRVEGIGWRSVSDGYDSSLGFFLFWLRDIVHSLQLWLFVGQNVGFAQSFAGALWNIREVEETL
jgi:hypothetical protein